MLKEGTALGRGEGAWPSSSGVNTPQSIRPAWGIPSHRTTARSLCLSSSEQAGSATHKPLETTLKSFLCWLSVICPQDRCVADSTAMVLSGSSASMKPCPGELQCQQPSPSGPASSSLGTSHPRSQKSSAHPGARIHIKPPPCLNQAVTQAPKLAGTFISLLNIVMTTTSSFEKGAGRGHEALVMQG